MPYEHITTKQYAGSKGEPNNGKLVTVQNDAPSIRTLMERYANGIPLQFRQSEYLDAEDIRSINKFYSPALDLTDIDTLNEQVFQLDRTRQALEKQIQAIAETPDPQVDEVS